MPIGRFLRHGHIFHPVRVLVCHSCAIICNSLVFWLLYSSALSHNVKKLYIPVNLLYSGDRAEFISCARAGTEDSTGPPHCVGPLFSGANAVSILRPRTGWSFECDSLAGVSIKTFFAHVEFNIRHAVSKSGHFTHDMTFIHHDVRGKRFNTHGTWSVKRNRDDVVEGTVLDTHLVQVKTFFRNKTPIKALSVPSKTFSRYKMNHTKCHHVARKARRGWGLWRHGRP